MPSSSFSFSLFVQIVLTVMYSLGEKTSYPHSQLVLFRIGMKMTAIHLHVLLAK